jgi:hypothetical protein
VIIYSLKKYILNMTGKWDQAFRFREALTLCPARFQVIYGVKKITSLTISEDSGPEDLEALAVAVHSVIGLPTTIRSLKRKGLRLEKGKILDRDYTGPVLEEVLKTNKVTRKVPTEGVYRGKHVVVAPIHSKEGKVVAAIGVVDILAIIDLPSVFQEYMSVLQEVEDATK